MSGTSSVPEIKFASASTPTIEQGFRDSIKDVLKKLNEYASDTLIVVQTFQSLVTWFNDKLTKEVNSSQSNGLPPGGDWCTAFLDTDFAEGVRLLLKRSYLSSSSMYFSASDSLSVELDVAFRCLVACVDLALDLVRLDHPTGGVILCIVFEEHNAFYNRYGFDVPDDEKNKIASIGDTEEYKEFRQNKLTAGMWIDFFNGSKWFPAEVTQDREHHIMVKEENSLIPEAVMKVSPRIAPLFTRSHREYGWRKDLVIGSAIDARDCKSIWYYGTVKEIRENGITFIISFQGWSEKCDEDIQRTSVRLAPRGTRACGGREAGAGVSDIAYRYTQPVMDDSQDPPFDPSQNAKDCRYVAFHGKEFGSYFLTQLLNHFGAKGGFDVLLKRLMHVSKQVKSQAELELVFFDSNATFPSAFMRIFDVPALVQSSGAATSHITFPNETPSTVHLRKVIEIIGHTHNQLTKAYAMHFIPQVFYHSILTLLSFSDKEMRDIGKEDVEVVEKAFELLLKRIMTSENAEHEVVRVKLSISLKRFRSSNLQQKIGGLQNLQSIVDDIKRKHGGSSMVGYGNTAYNPHHKNASENDTVIIGPQLPPQSSPMEAIVNTEDVIEQIGARETDVVQDGSTSNSDGMRASPPPGGENGQAGMTNAAASKSGVASKSTGQSTNTETTADDVGSTTARSLRGENLGSEKVKVKPLDSAGMAAWLDDNGVLEECFAYGVHLEIMKKSTDLLRFLLDSKHLHRKHMDILWAAIERSMKNSDETTVTTVYKVLEDIATRFEAEQINYIFEKMDTIAYMDILPANLDLLKELAKWTLTSKGLPFQRASEKLWFLVQDGSGITNAIRTHAMNALADIMGMKNHEYAKAARVGFFLRCLDNLKQGKSVDQSLSLLSKMIETQPERSYFYGEETRSELVHKLEDKYQLMEHFFAECKLFKSSVKIVVGQVSSSDFVSPAISAAVSSLLSEKNSGLYLRQVNSRLEFLQLFLAASTVSLRREQLDTFWDVFVVKSVVNEERDVALRWLRNAIVNEPVKRGNVPILTPEDLQNLYRSSFITQLTQSDQEIMLCSPAAFFAFEAFFLEVNKANSSLVCPRSDSYEGLYVIDLSAIEGLECIWALAMETRDETVSKKATDLLNALYEGVRNTLPASSSTVTVVGGATDGTVYPAVLVDDNEEKKEGVQSSLSEATKSTLTPKEAPKSSQGSIYPRVQQIKQAYINKCMDFFEKYLGSKNWVQLERCLSLINQVSDASEAKVFATSGRMRPHHSGPRGTKISLIVQHKFRHSTLPDKFPVDVYAESSLRELRVIISRIFSICPDSLTLFATGKKLKSSQDSHSINSLNLKDGYAVLVSRNIPNGTTSGVPLLDANKQGTPAFLAVLNALYDRYATTESAAGKVMMKEDFRTFLNFCLRPNSIEELRFNSLCNQYGSTKDFGAEFPRKSFIAFYVEACVDRITHVWVDLVAHNYRADLRKEEDVLKQYVNVSNKDGKLLPRFMFSNLKSHFKTFLSALDVNEGVDGTETSQLDSIRTLVWKLLQRLCTNNERLHALTTLRNVAIPGSSQNDGWEILLPFKNNFHLLYSLQVLHNLAGVKTTEEDLKEAETSRDMGVVDEDEIEALCEDAGGGAISPTLVRAASYVNVNRNDWCSSFLAHGGFSYLCHILMNVKSEPKNKIYQKESYALLLNLITFFLTSAVAAQKGGKLSCIHYNHVTYDHLSIKRDEKNESGAVNEDRDASLPKGPALVIISPELSQRVLDDFASKHAASIGAIMNALALADKGSKLVSNEYRATEDENLVESSMSLLSLLTAFQGDTAYPLLFRAIEASPEAFWSPLSSSASVKTRKIFAAFVYGLCSNGTHRFEHNGRRQCPLDFFLNVLLQFVPTSSSASAGNVNGDDITNFDDSKMRIVMDTEEFFFLLSLLIKDAFLQSNEKGRGGDNSDHVERQGLHNFEPLLHRVISQLKSHRSSEAFGRGVTTDAVEDKMMVGLFNLLKQLVACDPSFAYLAGDQSKGDMIRFLFDDCLFGSLGEALSGTEPVVIGEKWSRFLARKITFKCKAKKSRTAAFNLLIELSSNCLSNLCTLLTRLSSLLPSAKKPASFSHNPDKQLIAATRYVGLRNLGSTCYINSLMQQFFMTPQLRYAISVVQDPLEGKEESLLWQLKSMYGNLINSERQAYDMTSFCSNYKEDGNPMNPRIQQDLNEFFCKFTDRLEKSLEKTKYSNIMNLLFNSKLITQMKCEGGCGTITEKEEVSGNVSLTVIGNKTMQDSLSSYILPEPLSGVNCDACKTKVTKQKKSVLGALSPYIFFHLKRFEFSFETFLFEKVNNRLEFPLTIDLEPYTKEGQERLDLSRQQQQAADPSIVVPQKYSKHPEKYYVYELVGIIVHTGSANSGHYYSFIKDRNFYHDEEDSEKRTGKWFEFNDNIVKPFDILQNLEHECFGGSHDVVDKSYGMELKTSQERSMSAYMLVYQRKSELEADILVVSEDKANRHLDDEAIEKPMQKAPSLDSLGQTGQTVDHGVSTSSQVKPSDVDAGDEKKGDAMDMPSSASPSVVLDSGVPISFHTATIEEVVDSQILAVVNKDNMELMIDRLLFNQDIFDFVAGVAKIAAKVVTHHSARKTETSHRTVGSDMNCSGDVSSDESPLSLASLQAIAVYTLDAVGRSKESRVFTDLIVSLKSLNADVSFVKWLLNYMSENSQNTGELLLVCREDEIRKNVTNLLSDCLKKLAPLEVGYLNNDEEVVQASESKEPAEMLKQDPSKGYKEKTAVVSRPLSISRRYINAHLSLIEESQKHWMRFSQYLELLYNICCLGYQYRHLLVQAGMIITLTDMFLGQESTFTKRGNLGSPLAPADFTYLMKSLSLLCRTCTTYSTTVEAPADTLVSLDGPVLEISETSMAAFQSRRLYELCLTNSICVDSICEIAVHWSYTNIAFSEHVLRMIVDGVQKSSESQVKPYFDLMAMMVQVDDNLTQHRFDLLCQPSNKGVLHLLHFFRERYPVFTYNGIKLLLNMISTNKIFAEYLMTIRPQWTWMDQWLKNYIKQKGNVVPKFSARIDCNSSNSSNSSKNNNDTENSANTNSNSNTGETTDISQTPDSGRDVQPEPGTLDESATPIPNSAKSEEEAGDTVAGIGSNNGVYLIDEDTAVSDFSQIGKHFEGCTETEGGPKKDDLPTVSTSSSSSASPLSSSSSSSSSVTSPSSSSSSSRSSPRPSSPALSPELREGQGARPAAASQSVALSPPPPYVAPAAPSSSASSNARASSSSAMPSSLSVPIPPPLVRQSSDVETYEKFLTEVIKLGGSPDIFDTPATGPMSPSSTAAFSSRSDGGHLGDFDLNGVDEALPYESASTYVSAHSSSAIPNKGTPGSSGSHSGGSSSTKSRNNKRREPSPEPSQQGNGVVTTVKEEMECDDEEFSQTNNNHVRFDTNNRANDGGGHTGTPNSDDTEWACPACTFLNPAALSACEICASKRF